MKLQTRMYFILCFLLILTVNLISDLYILILSMAVMTAFLIFFTGKERVSLKRFFYFFLLAAFISFIQVITIGDTPLYHVDAPFIKLQIYKEGLIQGTGTFMHILLSVGIINLFLRRVSRKDLLDTLKEIGLPHALVEIIVFSVKYIYIFKEEIGSIRMAQRARLGYSNTRRSIRSLSAAGGIILLRVFDKSTQLAKAIRCRGYNGNDIIR
ncbi:MAG: energy-coupling factor transporter transmembrane protein EcfT [Clostridia bacterium]|nr:energy-coupling factor transporter transmembrane protein EcfT [Clostridia bacterium]